MKRIFTLLAVAAAALVLTSCEKKGNGKLDPSAKVYITAAQMPQSAPGKAEGKTLTPLEIVKTAQLITFDKGSISVMEWNRDTTNTRFIVGSDWVISESGKLTYEFIGARDYAFVTLDENNDPKDTIAYIPNEVMDKAQKEIEAAYAAENFAECYRLLQEAFEFIPTTGAEYRELQKQGLN